MSASEDSRRWGFLRYLYMRLLGLLSRRFQAEVLLVCRRPLLAGAPIPDDVRARYEFAVLDRQQLLSSCEVPELELLFVRAQNLASRRALSRIPQNQTVGAVLYVMLFGKLFSFVTAGARRYGIRIVSTPHQLHARESRADPIRQRLTTHV